MSKKTPLALAALVAIALPATAFGQIGVGARVGTLGLGGEVSFGIGSRLGIRAGLGVVPGDIKTTLDDIEYTLNPPSNIWNLGVDFYPLGGGLHLSAGILNRKKFEMTALRSGTTQVGGTTYNGTITIDGSLENARETAPYAAIGFGKTYGSGIGLFVDLGAAQMGEADIRLTGTCVVNGTQQCPSQNGKTFQQTLDEEAAQAEEDAGGYLKWHPILQIGLKFGFGG